MISTADYMATYDGTVDHCIDNDGVADNIVATVSLPTTTDSWAMGP